MESLVNGGTEFYRLKYSKKKTLIDSIPEKKLSRLGGGLEDIVDRYSDNLVSIHLSGEKNDKGLLALFCYLYYSIPADPDPEIRNSRVQNLLELSSDYGVNKSDITFLEPISQEVKSLVNSL